MAWDTGDQLLPLSVFLEDSCTGCTRERRKLVPHAASESQGLSRDCERGHTLRTNEPSPAGEHSHSQSATLVSLGGRGGRLSPVHRYLRITKHD